VMVLGTLKGIVVAIVLSMVSILSLANNPRVDELRRKPGTQVFRPRSDEHPEDESIPGLLIARPEGGIYFANARNVSAKLRELAPDSLPAVVLLDFSAVPMLEFTALQMLIEAEEKLRSEGTELWLAALNPEVLAIVQRTPLAERLGRERMYFTVEQAARAFEARQSV